MFRCRVSVLVATVVATAAAGALSAPAADAKVRPPAKVSKARTGAITRHAVTVSWRNPKSKRFAGTVVRIAKGATPPKTVKAGRAVATVKKRRHAVTIARLSPGTLYTVGLFSSDGRRHYSKAVAVRFRTAPAAKPPVVTKPPVTPLPPVVTPPAPGPTGTWGHPSLSLPRAGAIASISCPTSTFCMAVDLYGNAVARRDGQWSSPIVADPPVAGQTAGPELSAVSCVDATFCVAASWREHAVMWDGTSWTASPYLGVKFTSMGCATRTVCFATARDEDGGRGLWRFDGDQWSSDDAFLDDTPSQVTCSSATWCAATLGSTVAVWNGSWHISAGPSGFGGSLGAISCPQAASCVVADSDGETRTFVNGAWGSPRAIGALEDDYLRYLECNSASSCFAGDGTAVYNYSGSQWAAGPSASGSGLASVADVYCSAAGCLASDGVMVGPVDSAGFGTATSVDPYRGGTNELECVGAGLCIAGSQLGEVAETAGSGWTVRQTPLTASIVGISCPTTTFCLAVDDSGAAATRSSTVWTRVAGLTGGVGFEAVSCSTSTFCLGFDTNNRAWKFNGSSWIDARFGAPSATDVDISCSSPGFCAASLGASIAVYSDGSWTTFASPAGDDNAVLSISCPADRNCFAAAVNSRVYHLVGTTWTQSAELLFYPDLYGLEIDCASTSFCMASTRGYNGDNDAVPDGIWTLSGSKWSAQEQLELQPAHVSCGASNFCAAADDHGYLVTAG